MTRDELLRKLDSVQTESAAYWSAFAAPVFFAKLGEAWSPAENVRHLAKSIRPVTKALRLPRIALWAMFGRSRRESVSYDALVERYRGVLDAGGKAGKFAPSPRDEQDLESRRTEVLAEQSDANAALRAALAKWSEAALDRYQLPHPLLGKLTVREMVMFTLYHQLHHMAVVERRRAGR